MHYGSLISIRFFLAPIQRITHEKFRNFSRVKGRAWIIVELRHKRRVTSLHYITLHNVVGLLNASADAYSYRERNWLNATVAITTSQVVMATWLVQETEIQISVRGERHLGTVIGNDEYGKEYYSSHKKSVCKIKGTIWTERNSGMRWGRDTTGWLQELLQNVHTEQSLTSCITLV